MLYVIYDMVTNPITGHTVVTTLRVCGTEEAAHNYLTDPETLKKIKGSVKIDKVVL